ncbi:MAG: hypothetical protein RLZZ308_148 [Candidatus Parcubacteria bacterium]|jgi:FkbM family methyltransferase
MLTLKIFLKQNLPFIYKYLRLFLFKGYLFYRKIKIKKLTKKTTGSVRLGSIHFPIVLSKQNGFVDEEIFWKGCYEEEVLLEIKKQLQPGDTFVDIGANIGEHTLFAYNINKQGHVIAFEPIPFIYNQLQESITLNKASTVTVHNIALGNSNEQKTITVNKNNAGGSSVVTTGDKDDQLTITIKKGDEYLLDEDRINLIKIDTEGYEYEVLLGIEKTITKHRPKLIIEFSPYFYNLHETTKEHGNLILTFLEKHHYAIEGIDLPLPKKTTNLSSAVHTVTDQINLLCTPL